MEMHDLLKKIGELSTLAESKESTHKGGTKSSDAGVTKHKGKYGTEYQGDADDEEEDADKKKAKKADDAPKRGRGRPKKNADSSTGQVAKYDNAANLQSFMVGNIPKDKKGKPALPGKASKKHSLKEWFDELDAMLLAENTTTSSAATTPSSTAPQFKVVNNPNGSKEVVDSKTGMSTEYPANVANQATIQATKLNAQAQKDAASSGTTTAMEEGEGDKKWIKGAIKKPGAFSKKAAAHGKSTGEFASDVIAHKEKYPAKTEKQAVLAKTLSKLGKKSKSVKEAQPESNDSTLSPLSLGAKIEETPDNPTSKAPKAKAKKSSWKNSLREAAKPDFPDVDDDGNRKESIKSAAASAKAAKAKKKPVKEGHDSCRAAYHEGKCHAFENGHYRCRYDEGMDERDHYHRGFMEGLEECYGGGQMVEEGIGAKLLGGAALIAALWGINQYQAQEIYKNSPQLQQLEKLHAEAVKAGNTAKAKEYEGRIANHKLRLDLGKGEVMRTGTQPKEVIPEMNRSLDEEQFMSELDALDEEMDEMGEGWDASLDEMNKTEYMKHKAKTTPGNTFKAFGQTMHDKDVLEGGMNDLDISEDPMLESWDKQLNQLLSEDAIKEGLTVSTSTGQHGMPDSVSISASDEDAQKLMDLLKMSGLNGVGAQSHQSQPMGQLTARITQIASDDDQYDYEQEGDEQTSQSDDPHCDVENGHRSTDIMTMPLGKHFSQNVEPEEIKVVEPYEHDEVIDALDCGDEMRRITNKLIQLESMEDSGKAVTEKTTAKSSKSPVLAMPEGNGVSKEPTEKEREAPEAYEHDDVMKSLSDGGSKKKVDESELPMPKGNGVSKESTEKEREAPEAYEHDDVMKSLNKGGSKKKKVDESELPMPIGNGFSDPKTKDTPAEEVEPEDFDEVQNALSKEGGKEQEDDGGFARLKSMLQSQWGKGESTKKVKESREKCDECGELMEDDHECDISEKLDEWANTRSASRDEDQLGKETFMANEEYMINSITGGLNGKKPQHSHGYRQNDNPLAMKENMPEDGGLSDWLKLSGIR